MTGRGSRANTTESQHYEHMSTETNTSTAEKRNLSEEDVRRLAEEETSVRSSDGKTVRLADMIAAGLNKQQAIAALGLVALGAGASSAIAAVSTNSAQAVTSTGEGTVTIGELIANDILAGEIETESLSGGIVGSAGAIDHLEGNIYVSDDEPTSSPNDGDLWFQTGDL